MTLRPYRFTVGVDEAGYDYIRSLAKQFGETNAEAAQRLFESAIHIPKRPAEVSPAVIGEDATDDAIMKVIASLADLTGVAVFHSAEVAKKAGVSRGRVTRALGRFAIDGRIKRLANGANCKPSIVRIVDDAP